MMEKRYRKVESARRELRDWNVVDEWGDPGAEIGIIGWGSTKGTVREAMARAMQEGIRVGAIFPEMLLPMPDEEIRAFIDRNYDRAKNLLVENIDKLHMMADALIKYETIDSNQIDDIMSGREPRPPEDWSDQTPPPSPGATAADDKGKRGGPVGDPAGQH